ncbi:Peptidyl-prolyl cis-trans isomerase FKBP65 [Schistosoma japonicum]|nr:Peptidyl-prolyl cis-trans isomerase FKBP65 [Schistosoma japonicum]
MHMECLRSESNKVCDNQPTNLIMSPGSKTVISKQTKACENLHQDCNQKHKGDRYCKGSCNPALLQNLSTLDEDCTVIDDTRKYGKTMELYSGKEFQLEFWEQCLGTMLPGEVSSFVVPAERLASFPAVNKKLRDYMLNKKDHSVKHCCGLMSLQEQGGLGYSDLDELMMKPEPLEFIFDLVKVEIPGTGRKDTWIMTPEEKFATVPVLREEGNQLYSHGEYNKAAICYSEALGILDQLILREKPGEPEWIELDKSRIPLFVNLAQCQFKEKNYYAAIQNTTEALSRDPTNIKALYRRSKAYIETWDLDLATEDLRKLAICRPDMKKTVENELNMIESKRVDQEIKERQKLAGKLCTRPKLIPSYEELVS